MRIDGFFEKRLLAYLAGLVSAQDALDYTAHDKRYHGGRFDPATMTCTTREAEETGDLVDVLRAEREEKAYAIQKFKDACRRVSESAKDASDEEVAICCCNYGLHTEKRFKALIRKFYQAATVNGGGTKIGEIEGIAVYPHKYMDDEIVGSGNAKFLKATNYEAYMDKARMVRHLKEIMIPLKLIGSGGDKHKSKRHRAWMKAKGFWYAQFEYRGRPWYFVFTRTADDRLLLYDYVQKEL